MTHNYATVNGIKLHYVEEGQGPLVIMLHGFPEFWYSWRSQIPALSKKYRVVVPDMRGYNLSDKPQGLDNYKMDLLATDIKQLVHALGEKQAIIVGHDWGGAVSWALASMYPEVVSKLAVLNIPHPAEMKKALYGGNLRQLMRSYYIFMFQLPRIPEWFISRNPYQFFKRTFISFSPKRKGATEEELNEYVKAYTQPGGLTGIINYYRATIQKPVSIKAEKPLPMPVLMLWGEHDKALGKELTYNTKKYCDNLEIIYDPTSGHFIQHDNPEWVNEKLLAFLAK